MSPEVIDYAAVLADLKRRRDALDTAINAIQQIVSSGAATGGQAVNGDQLESGAFFGMSIADAARKYLSIVRRKKSAREIADALEKGGLSHTSKNFYNTVYTLLHRESKQDNPQIVKVGDGWGLTEWYPGRRFKRTAKGVVAESGSEVEDLPSDPSVEAGVDEEEI